MLLLIARFLGRVLARQVCFYYDGDNCVTREVGDHRKFSRNVVREAAVIKCYEGLYGRYKMRGIIWPRTVSVEFPFSVRNDDDNDSSDDTEKSLR